LIYSKFELAFGGSKGMTLIPDTNSRKLDDFPFSGLRKRQKYVG